MYLESARILLSIIMLGYTSWVDIKTREIYDLVWIIFGGLGLALNIYEVVTGVYTVIDVVVPVAWVLSVFSEEQMSSPSLHCLYLIRSHP